MSAAENRADDIGRQERETEQPRRIGRNERPRIWQYPRRSGFDPREANRGLRWLGREDAQGRYRELRALTHRRR